MDQLIARSALPPPEIDVELLPARRYRSDYAWPERRITLEVDGTIRGAQGGHQSEDGMTSDARKALLLAIDGWLTVRVTATMIRSGEAIDLLERLFGVSRAGAAD